jgi:hypothetical protein
MSPSSLSSGSSLGPLTPPDLPYASLPGPTPFRRRRAYTDSSSGKARAHQLLALSDTPPLNFDITLHPSTISGHYMNLSSAGLLEPAVYPPQATISLATPHIPWTIPVIASNGRYVTVSDLLNSVYRELRVNATPAEFNMLGQKLMRRASAAYTRRCERLRGHRGYAAEKSQGMYALLRRGWLVTLSSGVKRVDFLMGYHKFQGISPGACGPDVWQIHIG